MTSLHQVDPYDFPFPQRSQTMSLQTISKMDVGNVRQSSQQRENLSLRTQDIQGAQTILPGYKYTNKPQNTGNLDIEGTLPKSTIGNWKKQTYYLTNEDIKGSQPQCIKFTTTRTPSNPLNPLYVLPYSEQMPYEQPKFIRNQIDVSDIRGTKPRLPFHPKVGEKEFIDGTKAQQRFIPKDSFKQLDVKDINEYMQFKSSRNTNPLTPYYGYEQNQDPNLGKSKILHVDYKNKSKSTVLNTLDIKGAQSNSVTENFLRSSFRKDFRCINQTNDVPGAQPDTLKRGMQTLRQTNPLDPKYPLLDQKMKSTYSRAQKLDQFKQ